MRIVSAAEIQPDVRHLAEQLESFSNWLFTEVFQEGFRAALVIEDDGKLQARCAKLISGTYRIYIGSGSFSQIFDTFYRALSNPSVAPDLDAGRLKVTPLQLVMFQSPTDLAEPQVVERYGSGTELPIEYLGNERLSCVNRLAIYALMWLVLHETAHIATGDLDYRRSLASRPELPPRDLDLAAEIYADIYAGNFGPHVVNHCLNQENCLRRQSAEPTVPLDFALRMWGVASALIKLLVNVGRELTVYPAPELRIVWGASSQRGMTPTHAKHGYQESDLDRITNGYTEGVDAWKKMGWPMRPRELKLDSTFRALENYQRKVRAFSPLRR